MVFGCKLPTMRARVNLGTASSDDSDLLLRIVDLIYLPIHQYNFIQQTVQCQRKEPQSLPEDIPSDSLSLNTGRKYDVRTWQRHT